ncbi:cytochrome o ubiquinol oxidase subunit IV [Ancylobacter mangrovi]|uniref:cytochrome o ubiquinol oxidase subunit IV n=1 Tax=Ancylobacter mangrovi TaxID=2972472 RepID=UPI0021626C42|nr:cytochrome o ubiquinol oxidase subunit IV [Ancylobacter mangrovi]MCS0502818.1 cytochrome o ubiquinol oxidase subunit IV [Ancylobacter mangrovi]
MSAHDTTAGHAHDDTGALSPVHHGHEDHGAEPHGSLRGYLIGFGLSVVLTAIPFWLVMTGVLGNATATALAIMGFAAVQIVVHMIYFLHMNFRSEGGWTMLALVFTLILVVITLAGSLWVMYHLNTNMMPGAYESRPMP